MCSGWTDLVAKRIPPFYVVMCSFCSPSVAFGKILGVSLVLTHLFHSHFLPVLHSPFCRDNIMYIWLAELLSETWMADGFVLESVGVNPLYPIKRTSFLASVTSGGRKV